MPRLKTMTTQYIDGEPNGVRVLLRTLSPITAVVVPRPLLNRAKQIEDLPRQGIYYLINDEDGAISRLYVGQTTQGLLRLDDHKVKKEFWNKAILFLADDKTFTLDTISALEKYAIDQAWASKRYSVENKIDPKYRIDQYQQPIIEEVYEEIAFVMASLGYDIEGAEDALTDVKVFTTTRRKIYAKGIYTGEKFDVLEGSPIDLITKPKLERYSRIRDELIASGDIETLEDDSGLLKKTISFRTPSGAADFVLGGSNNGWVEWKDKDSKTLDELYRK